MPVPGISSALCWEPDLVQKRETLSREAEGALRLKSRLQGLMQNRAKSPAFL